MALLTPLAVQMGIAVYISITNKAIQPRIGDWEDCPGDMRKVGLLSKVLGSAAASFAKYFGTETIVSAAYARVLAEGLNRGRHPPAGKHSIGWLAFEDEDARVVSFFVNCLMKLDVGYRHLVTHFLGGQRTFGGGVRLLFPRLEVVCTQSGVISRRDRIIEIPHTITQERQMTDAIISSAGLAASQI